VSLVGAVACFALGAYLVISSVFAMVESRTLGSGIVAFLLLCLAGACIGRLGIWLLVGQ